LRRGKSNVLNSDRNKSGPRNARHATQPLSDNVTKGRSGMSAQYTLPPYATTKVADHD